MKSPQQKQSKSIYRGRFAPSPSGPLHFGSLVCALASYLDAKANAGIWLVRMEDIDPPREQAGAASLIMESLHAHGLYPDEQVCYQSARGEKYWAKLNWLLEQNLAYRCSCTRKRLSILKGVYDRRCLNSIPASDAAVAIRVNLLACMPDAIPQTSYKDSLRGRQDCTLNNDFIIHRKDGLFAYQLAVVVDDIEQGISHVVRGADLLESTAQQAFLFNLFGSKVPTYTHIPVLVDKKGDKLSKQTHAQPIANNNAIVNIRLALNILGLDPPAQIPANTTNLLEWAIAHWQQKTLARSSSILAPSHTM